MEKIAVLLASALVAAGCYNPNVSSSGLMCAAAPAKQCPDGFECAGGFCLKVGAVGGGGTGGAARSGGAPGSGGTIGSGGRMGTGGGAPSTQPLGANCLITNQGQATQSHNCDPGLLCVDDCGGSSSRCYKICQGDADCAQSSCTRAAPGGAPLLCEVPYTMCNPQNTATSGCGTGIGCYLLASAASPSGGDRTVCDCSMSAGGMGDPCFDSRGCFPGLVCPPAGSGAGAGSCWLICDPTAMPSGCPAAHPMCRPFGAKWGYCF